MQELEDIILDVLDGLGADDETLLFIYPTSCNTVFDVELRYEDSRLRVEVIREKLPMVTLVETRGWDVSFERLFINDLIGSLY